MSALFLELDKTVLFLSFPLAPHEEVVKAVPVVRLATKNLLISFDVVVGFKLLATTLADKHKATVLPNCMLVRRLQRLESPVTDNAVVNSLHHVLCPTTLIRPSNFMISLTNCHRHLQETRKIQTK